MKARSGVVVGDPVALHWRVVVGHRLRTLDPEGLKRIHGAPLTVLLLLWSRCRDPFAEAPCVAESYASLSEHSGYTERTVQRAIQVLAQQSMLARVGSRAGVGTTYRLLRPTLDDATTAELAGRNPFEPSSRDVVHEIAAALRGSRRSRSKKSDAVSPASKYARRRDTLERLQVTRRDVALALEYGSTPPEDTDPTLVYSGSKAHSVNEAIDYLEGKRWVDLLEVVATAKRVGVPSTKCLLAKYRAKVLEAMNGETTVDTGARSEGGTSEAVSPDAVQSSGRPRLRARIADELGLANASAIESRLLDFADERERSLAEIHEALDVYVALAPSDRPSHELHEVLA